MTLSRHAKTVATTAQPRSAVSRHVVLLDATGRRLNAGPKARLDTAAFLSEAGFGVASVPTSRSRYWRALLTMILRCAPIPWGRGDVLWVQYPPEATTQTLVQRARRRGARTVAFVHDIEALKRARLDEALMQSEVHRLRGYDAVIALNPTVDTVLRKRGVHAAATMGLWDYRCKVHPMTAAAPLRLRVAFAGNLSPDKAGFIGRLGVLSPLCFELYGEGVDPGCVIGDNVRHLGHFAPDEPPFTADGSFGLVWDGPDLGSCHGDFGTYLRYNTPHKASMFLAAGVPLLVWNEAAIAAEILTRDAGLAVSSLQELPKLLGELTEQRYRELARNASALGAQIRAGYFIKRAAAAARAALDQ